MGTVHADYFARPNQRAFLRTAAYRLAERGQWRPAVLEIDGTPVAVQLCLEYSGTLYRFHSGYDPAWAWYGIMSVLFAACIKDAIARGCTELYLLLGADQEKVRWGCIPARS